ncbi:uncharacterized protein FOMMEDRAFT_109008 [Fomitiporia mediterranea MF3/22]|uniref:uncharacterized protein n=1 Tax=Fomitiporia mediterranea (strain MF3/22) TaxID=694068 RepID=UPI0004409043|nr:uncharacterized protein FOMMEDRAFT_109008 [Fomitiporia mediterranea MF3/22]EJD01957.1 hypothetical protein FOMMEDRAFT_109008 [Fomitiporia mediterranea MF3/22]
MAEPLPLERHKLLVANRGEIALRILRTAKHIGLRSVAVYTQVDATSPHVLLADEAVALLPSRSSSTDAELEAGADVNAGTNARAYVDANAVVKICVERGVTLVHPGYGFLSENADFAFLLEKHGIILLGPQAQIIEDMGLKHRARELAQHAGVPVVPGSVGLVERIEDAVQIADEIGYPVMLKATAGGGGMGLVVCGNAAELQEKIVTTKQKAKNIFHNEDVFIEKFFSSSRHIEIQIFGNGCGHVIHMGERECSIQRRHQKIIEEAPSPYFAIRQGMVEKMYAAAVGLGELVNYKSAGTVEFLVDTASETFYFLEMNTRLQVEHGVTEMLYRGLDIVELMILQGVYEHQSRLNADIRPGLPPDRLDQEAFGHPNPNIHAIEARVYSENPANNFSPSPGILQYVQLPEETDDLRIDTWVSTGMVITPFYDPLVAKVISRCATRKEAIEQLVAVFDQGKRTLDTKSHIVVQGPPNNIPFLVQVLKNTTFVEGNATTEWIDRGGLPYTPNAFAIISPGIQTSVQSLPTRDTGLGIPPSGPMDPLAFQAGNALIGNPFGCEGLELVIPPKSSGHARSLSFIALFYVEAVVAVTGAHAIVTVDGREAPTWGRIIVPRGAKLVIGALHPDTEYSSGGFRAYLAVLGGFPRIPEYLGSKSTSMGSGGYQGRNLQTGDMLEIQLCVASANDAPPLPHVLLPDYHSDWTLYSLPGPHDDTEFLTESGIEAFYSRKWRVSAASNRMGIRLEPVNQEGSDAPALDWARQNGGEGGSHPSNILDNGYPRGSVNLNGDTPVVLTNEGPSMGGYLCISTIATADQWKLGQLRPGDQLQFKRISYSDAIILQERADKWLETIFALSSGFNASPFKLPGYSPSSLPLRDPKLHSVSASSSKPKAVFRQAGDSAILVEYGEMTLDFSIRARIHALETVARQMQIPGIKEFAPCIRSTMVHFDPRLTTQAEVLAMLIEAEQSLPESIEDMRFPGRRLKFPIVLDDKWNRDALERYMRSSRSKAVYLPSNIEYLAANNGVEGGATEALRLLVSSPWLVFGVGFYLACPFLVPINPRCRLVGQKMNPSRTYTPRGAVGIAGLVAAIYPVESPGGYQLFGCTLPTWQPWGKGPDFAPERPWLLEPFDQVTFESVSEEEYIEMEKHFDSGRYAFKIEPVVFSMKEYLGFVSGIHDEILAFRARQAKAVASEEARESVLLKEWLESKRSNAASSTSTATEESQETPNFVSASLSGSVWKIKAAVSDIITSPDQVVAILEAMKTEINITAGEENVGLKVSGFAKGIKEGSTVQAGDKLMFFVET